MIAASILSIQIGVSAETKSTGTGEWWDKSWVSGFNKSPVTAPVWLAYGGLRGDEQADRVHHGGVDKAVCVYPIEYYRRWRTELSLSQMEPGAFGENFITSGLTEAGVSIGDVFEIDDARVQISQPRHMLETGPPLAHQEPHGLGGTNRTNRFLLSRSEARLD
jgi:MOSC domain-containing protein YiiM